MYNFKYDIKINEETNRPYIDIDDDFDIPENKFAAFEIAIYMLIAVYNERKKIFDENEDPTEDDNDVLKEDLEQLQFVIDYLLELSDEMALVIKDIVGDNKNMIDFLKSINVNFMDKNNKNKDE